MKVNTNPVAFGVSGVSTSPPCRQEKLEKELQRVKDAYGTLQQEVEKVEGRMQAWSINAQSRSTICGFQ
eukprot:5554903-Amphidinium_carterae.1